MFNDYVLGIDSALKGVAFAFLPVDSHADPVTDWVTPVHSKGDQWIRLRQMRNALRAKLETWKTDGLIPTRVFLEVPFENFRNPKTSLITFSVSAVVRLELEDFGCQVNMVDNSHWKKEIIGKGNADKSMIREYLLAVDSRTDESWTDDFFDAWGLALYGRQQVLKVMA